MNESNGYRSNLVKKFKALRSVDEGVAQEYLGNAQQTKEYQEARDQKIEKHAKVFELKNKTVTKEENTETEERPNVVIKEQVDVIKHIKERLSKFFEVQEASEGQIKVVLKDQMQFMKWPDVLKLIKEKSILKAEFFDPDNVQDDSIILVTNQRIQANDDSNEFNITIRFDKKDIDEKSHERIKKDKTFTTAHILSPIKPEAITMHLGMLHSISF